MSCPAILIRFLAAHKRIEAIWQAAAIILWLGMRRTMRTLFISQQRLCEAIVDLTTVAIVQRYETQQKHVNKSCVVAQVMPVHKFHDMPTASLSLVG